MNEQQDQNARDYIQALKNGQRPEVRPELGKWEHPINFLEKVYSLNPGAVENTLQSMVRSRRFSGLETLIQ